MNYLWKYLAVGLSAFLILALGIPAHAANLYVSTSGNDSNTGTQAQPFKTLQHAASEAKPGDTVNVLGGVYCQQLSLTSSGSPSAGYITFRGQPGQSAVLDGSCMTPPHGKTALIHLHDVSYVKIEHLEIRNYKTSDRGSMPCGICIDGHGSHIELLNNNVHNIEQTAPRHHGPGGGSNGFGIAIYGTDITPITDLVVAGNEVHHLQTGYSESLTLNGNVTHFRVTGNRVHSNSNIGIDIIGFEHTAPNPSVDRARDGIVNENLVYDIPPAENTAHPKSAGSDGIYVDGGTRVVIERNTVHDVPFGIETASEHFGHNSSYITIRNNLIYFCHNAGISIGGYDLKRGGTHDVTIVNNTLYEDDAWHSGTGEFGMQYRMRNNVFKNNIVYVGKDGLSGRSLSGPMQPGVPTVTMDHNVWYFPAGPDAVKWSYDAKEYDSFQAYVKATGQDQHSGFADPRFVDPLKGNFHLKNGSSAVHNGADLGQAIVGTKDLDGAPRVSGGKIDIGCYQSR